jgi:cytochrome c551/c552
MPEGNEVPTQSNLDGWDKAVLGGAAGAAFALILFALIAAFTFESSELPTAANVVTTPAPPTTVQPVASGENVTQSFGCLACHSIDGSILVGPSWQGLAGAERVFDDGSTAIADTEYLRESIVNPGARIVEGFTNAMQADFGTRMTSEEIDAVIEYIQGL